MFTSPLPLLLDRYQVRYMGTRPITARADRALDGFVQSGVLTAVDLGQATRNGVPSWNVSLIIRDRATGIAAPVTVRVDAPTQPHTELNLGQTVGFDLLEVGWPEFGRHDARFSYAGMRPTDAGDTKVAPGLLNRFAVSADDLMVEVQQVRPKLDESLASASVRALAKDQGVDLAEHLPQATTGDGIPKWVLDTVIVTPESVFLEKINVTGHDMPMVSGVVTVDGLTIMGGTTPYPSSTPWVSLSVDRVTSATAAAPDRARRGRNDQPPAENTEGHPAESHA